MSFCKCGKKVVSNCGIDFCLTCVREMKRQGFDFKPVVTADRGNKAWSAIHSRYASDGAWDEQQERQWYEDEWLPMIPSYGCSCKEEWKKLTEQYPIDFSTRENAFRSLWELHNKVNEKLGKPTITLEQAKDQWNVL